MPKISVIVPVYKVEEYLHRCVDSILDQSFMSFDLVLVDDGSPDCCGRICDEYAQKDSRIHVIHQENRGPSVARNTGIDWSLSHSTSEWITFVDSDDWIHFRYLEILYAAACRDGTSISVGRVLKTQNTPLPNIEQWYSTVEKVSTFYARGETEAIVAWGKLYKKECFQTVRYPVGRLNEDAFTTHKVLFQHDCVSIVDQKLYAYYQNENSIMNRPWTPQRMDAFDAYEEQISFFLERNMTDIAGKRFRVYVRNCLMQLDLISASSKLSDDEKTLYQKEVRMHLRKALSKYRAYQWVTPQSRGDRRYYSNAYPSLKAIDKRWRHVKTAVKKIPGAVRLTHFVRDLPNNGRKLKNYLQAIRNTEAILLQTPLHGNLGDHAISLAENNLLRELGIRCADYPWTKGSEKILARFTPRDKLVLIHGGGFIGSLWPNEEERLENSLLAYNNQRVIVFPQTVYFDMDTPEGKASFEASRSILESHPDLTIFVRERYSYAFMKEYMPEVKTLLVPDIAMLLQPDVKGETRSGACICLRQDKERTLTDEKRSELIKHIQAEFTSLYYTDTVLRHHVNIEQREAAVRDKFEEFASSEIVVTDRLHGMIFAAITETPCIVVNSRSHKIRGCYEWIKSLDYIRFIEDFDLIPAVVKELKRVRPQYDRAAVAKAMAPLYEELKRQRQDSITSMTI